MAMQAGGWTIGWQGTDTKASDFPNGQTIGKAIATAVSQAGGQAVVSAEGTWSAKPDVAVVIYGERPYAEYQGDVPHLAFRSQAGEQELIARLKAQGIRVVSVFLSGRPMFTGAQINASDAFVAAWLPGSQGAGVADVLVAQANGKPVRDFTGRLPFAWPSNAISPVTQALFPAGYGLSYGAASTLGSVNEDPGVDLAAAASEDVYMTRGTIPSPWRLGLDSVVQASATDIGAQEDARRFTWSGRGGIAIDGPAVNLMRQLDGGFALLLDWRIDSASAEPVVISFGGGTLDVSGIVRSAKTGQPLVTTIPLRCFKDAGGELAAVGTPLRLTAGKGFVASLRSVRIEGQGSATGCPPPSKP